MKDRFIHILTFLLLLLLQGPAEAQRCGAVAPEFQSPIGDIATPVDFRGVIVIPVVVHVVYANSDQNISLDQIRSQLDVLNLDYRAMNDQSFIPNAFDGQIADLQLEFCLAVRDPAGQPTNGVVRVETEIAGIGNTTSIHYSSGGGSDSWDPDHYLNIWVADMGSNQTGRSSFPGEGTAAEDGVVVDPRYFGTTGLAVNSAPYNLGRTATHEIGHYFNLLHPWGPDPVSCQSDDGVDDTPLSGQTFLAECPEATSESCGTSDMYTNFMYYTDDACMAQFTPGQRNRVWETLYSFRSGLLESEGCISPDWKVEADNVEYLLFPNPTTGDILIRSTSFPGALLQVDVFTSSGQKVWETSCSYQPDVELSLPDHLAAGVYLIRITSGETCWGGKVVLKRI